MRPVAVLYIHGYDPTNLTAGVSYRARTLHLLRLKATYTVVHRVLRFLVI